MRRTTRLLASVVAGTTVFLAGGAATAAVPTKAKTTVEPCSLVTDEAVSELSGDFTISNTDALSKTNCLVKLQGDGESSTVNVFVDKVADYTVQKSLAKSVKAQSGLGTAAYTGVVGGDPVVEFKTKSAAVRLTSSFLELDELLLLAKGANKVAK